MKITDFLDTAGVISELASQEKNAALREMSDGLASRYKFLDHKKIFEVLSQRENISTTAIGDGVAIPHGKLPDVVRVLGLFARSPQGVDFASLDGGLTHLFFVLIAPENAAADHLKALARISRLLKDEGFRRRLMEGKTDRELFEIIAEEDQKL